MHILKIATWAAALFFVGSWTFGLLAAPHQRLKSTVVTVGLWWALLLFPALGAFTVFHLLWLMPLALVVPGAIQGGHLKRTLTHPSLGYIAVGSILPVLGPAAVLALF